MRTPGHDEELSVGFLRSEGIAAVLRPPCGRSRRQRDRRGGRRTVDFDRLARNFYTSSSCGVCGKGALEAVAVEAPRVESELVVSAELVAELPDRLREAQPAFAPPAACTRPGSSRPRESSSSSGRTWAGTTRWTRSSAGRSAKGSFRSRTSALRERPALLRARPEGRGRRLSGGRRRRRAEHARRRPCARPWGDALRFRARRARQRLLGAAAHRMTFNVAPEMYDRFMGRYGDALGRALSERAGVRPGMRALDVGAGTGKLTAVLTEILGEENVAAVDPSRAVRFGAGRAIPRCDVRRGTAEELPFEDGSFDAVFAQLVVNFLTDPEGGAAEMARVAKEGGVVAASGLGLPWRDDHAEGVLGGGGRGRRARRSGPRRAHADALWRAGGGRASSGKEPAFAASGRRDRCLRVLRGLRRSLGSLPRRSRPRRRLHCLARAGDPGRPPRGIPARLGSPEGPFELEARAWFAVGTK